MSDTRHELSETMLRQWAGEPRDLDENPWYALMEALYQKFGANADAHEFTDFAMRHGPWFEHAARAYFIIVQREAAEFRRIRDHITEREGECNSADDVITLLTTITESLRRAAAKDGASQ